MNILNKTKYKIGRLLEASPFTWWLAWTSAHYLTFLLPHDSSYFALKHFNRHRCKLFVDIGANAGISALSFRQINTTDSILSIEPNPIHGSSLARLKKKLSGFDYRLTAAGSQQGQLKLYMPVYKGVPLHTFASTSESQVRTAIVASYPNLSPSGLKITSWIVEVVTLDSLNVAPSVIKIDAEGADYQILEGADQTLTQWRPYVMFEAVHEDMARFKAFFTDRNYMLMSYNQEGDVFAPLAATIKYESGNRNVFAIPQELAETLPTRR